MQPCSFIRRLSAMFYDSLLLTAVLFAATFAVLPFVDGHAIDSTNVFYKLFLLMLAWLYFCWHWIKGGQTLGMRSWHVFVINESGQNPDWKQSTIRFLSALLSIGLLGAGFIWAIFDKEKRALHDHISRTRLVVKKP